MSQRGNARQTGHVNTFFTLFRTLVPFVGCFNFWPLVFEFGDVAFFLAELLAFFTFLFFSSGLWFLSWAVELSFGEALLGLPEDLVLAIFVQFCQLILPSLPDCHSVTDRRLSSTLIIHKVLLIGKTVSLTIAALPCGPNGQQTYRFTCVPSLGRQH